MSSSPSAPSARGRLFFMMVLELFIWGAWFPLVFGYLSGLKFDPTQKSLILGAFPFAAIVGMFFSNQFADRNFAAERFLGFSHLIGGLAILGWGVAPGLRPFFLVVVLHFLLYLPTLFIPHPTAFPDLN